MLEQSELGEPRLLSIIKFETAAYLDSTIATCTDNPSAIGTEFDTIDNICMPFVSLDATFPPDIPHL